jgi:mannosyl-oligosaccharide alpha-1,2-mannosidase
MIRDPFGIHSKNAFKATALRAARDIKEAATQAGANALEMSFSLPKHVPDFGDPSRALEDRAWAALSRRSGGGGGGGGKTGLFASSSDSLPMYKDKPYAYAPSMRLRPWWRRRKVLGMIAAAVMFVLYVTGFFSSGQTEEAKKKASGSAFSWLGLSQERGGVDWDERRKSVVEAFEVSWDAYERYAWGM